jgi:hypothetical protein
VLYLYHTFHVLLNILVVASLRLNNQNLTQLTTNLSHAYMSDSSPLWKQVPPELIYDHPNVWATVTGDVRINDKLIKGSKGAKGKHGYYPTTRMNNTTIYFHRLVYFAHSGKTVDELKRGRVIFRNVPEGESIIEDGLYRCWIEDLIFEPSKATVSDNIITHIETLEHPVYGSIEFGTWKPLYTFNKIIREAVKSDIYEICLINNPETPCLIRNKLRNKPVKYHFHDGHDGYIVLNHMHTNITYQITHILLVSAFPSIPLLKSSDHIDDNPKNHCILNLQWLSISDNSRKGQVLMAKPREKKELITISDEEWKSLPINDRTATDYSISNRGRVRRNKTNTIMSGSRLRGKKYSYCTITTALNTPVKYYIHHLVYMTFHGSIPSDKIILHDDSAPLTEDGVYRNWTEDLRAGSKGENNVEHHSNKRINKN